ncbi:hypothetical protein [Kitasatospora sp. NPDC051914]|uniref:hypothetical protein n=1 Tax=Kitasatospora sp. NPDC051914 TaxID=3154945 RepID=UPI00343BD4A8
MDHLYGLDGGCPCRVQVWDDNDGHTGWVPISTAEYSDDGLFFRPCSEHALSAVRRQAVAA